MIPGAFDKRVGAQTDPKATAQQSSVNGPTHAISDANRVQYQLEGGGRRASDCPCQEDASRKAPSLVVPAPPPFVSG
jgi:hypothetical protein